MANEIQKQQPKFSVAVRSDAYQRLINDTLGDKEVARTFVAEISTVVSLNTALQKCEAVTILSAGLVAQTLKLPLSPTLGFAYVIPYGNKAQFQIGWKGLVQLAQRTGSVETIGVRAVHKGEHVGMDEFGEDIFKFSHDYDEEETIGYYAYLKLIGGFKKGIYWTKEQCKKHALKYSAEFKKFGSGKWVEMFDEMAMKTVLKQLISKWCPQSVDIQRAIVSDQAVIGKDLNSYEYVDNEPESQESNVKNSIIEETKE